MYLHITIPCWPDDGRVTAETTADRVQISQNWNQLAVVWREPSRCVWSTIYCISAVVTQHIKSVALLQLVTFGYMFRPLPGHHQADKE